MAITSFVFLVAARMLNPLCFRLAPLALGVVFFYSFTKRFTSFSHLVLGFSLGIAPAAAWIAVRGSLDVRILLLTAAVTFWTAGFDIIYSCQDYEYDVDTGLFSLPRRLGIAGALWVSRFLHLLMVACLLLLIQQFELGPPGRRRRRGHCRPADLRTSAGQSQRPLARQRGLLHGERLRQRAILCVLGRPTSSSAR